MTKRFLNAVKTFFVVCFILFGVFACEKEFEDVGIGLVDNNLFDTKDTIFDVITYNLNIDSTRVDDNSLYLLGIYNDANFGYLKSSFISQVGLTTSEFGDNVSIDAVVLDIPYYATAQDDYDDGKPKFELDSIIGDKDYAYDISVYELGTFLNTLDPLDPSKSKKYYSNENYTKKDLLHKLEAFQPNANDTVLYVERRFLDNDVLTVDDIDTIKKADLKPSIKIPLDTTFFRTHFIDQEDTGIFDSYQNFIEYFRGIIIEPEGQDGSMMTLAMTDATITVYYTNDILTDESDTDLNGDGDTDDEDVPVRTKQSAEFSILGINVNKYERDYNGSEASDYFMSSNTEEGDDKLFIQGASGSMAVVELFKDIDLDELRNENWLINDASLTFYVDNPLDTIIPRQLFIYNYDSNSQILDNINEYNVLDGSGLGLYGYTGTGGILDNEDINNVKYKFSITDYVSELLKENSEVSLHKIGLKDFSPSDIYDPLNAPLDTLISSNSWRAKGVVLKGNNATINNVRLEIKYTKNNN